MTQLCDRSDVMETMPGLAPAQGVDDQSEGVLFCIEPSQGHFAIDLHGLWAYRELFAFLVWRDVKVRYKQTVLGAAWAVIQPLFAMLIFALFFGTLAKLPSAGVAYPLFAYAGLLPWTFFANAVASSGNSLVGSANLITKVYFPRLIIPAAAVAAGLVDFACGSALLVVLMGYYGIAPSWNVVMLPVFIALTVLLALAVGFWTSALNVRYRDVRHALPFLIQLWMFASPIIYPATLVPPRWRWVMALNPLTGIIEGFRAALFGRSIDWTMSAISAALTLVILAYSFVTFRGVERTFADIV